MNVVSHVAVLVKDVKESAARFRPLSLQTSEEKEYSEEGTREIYVGGDRSSSLLLVQAISEGPYQRAMEKRGVGLHHIAINVPHLGTAVLDACDAGWKKLEFMTEKSAYLSSPGFPGLIELQEMPHVKGKPVVEKLLLPIDFATCGNFKVLGLEAFIAKNPTPRIWIGGKNLSLVEL